MGYTKEDSQLCRERARNSNKSRFPDGYIYIIRFGDTDLYKIGVSRNPKRRVADIDASCPEPVRVLGVFKFKNVYEMEECVHDNFDEFRYRKEWFRMEPDFVKHIIDQLKELSKEGYYLIRKTV